MTLPPALFTAHPYASAISFPLQPPGIEQLEIVRGTLRTRIQRWHADQLATEKASSDSVFGLDANAIARSAQQHEEMSIGHLNLAYNHWMSLPFEVQREQWQLEMTRAFMQEAERRKSVEEQLARVQQEANQLWGQVTRLSSCQWPREFALFPPDFLPLSREVVRELDDKSDVLSPHSSRWNYDNLVAKWKRVVMHDRGMGRVGVGDSNGLDAGKSNTNNNAIMVGDKAQGQRMQPSHHSTGAGLEQPPTDAPQQEHRAVGRPPAKRARLMNTQEGDSNVMSG